MYLSKPLNESFLACFTQRSEVSGFIKNGKESNSINKPQPDKNDFNAGIKDTYTAGVAYFVRGEYDKAVVELEKSIETNPDHTESFYYLGQSYLQWGMDEYNKKHIVKAYGLYRKANKVTSANQWPMVVSVQVGLLMRSSNNSVLDVASSKLKYNILNQNVLINAADSRRLFRVYTTTINIQNRQTDALL